QKSSAVFPIPIPPPRAAALSPACPCPPMPPPLKTMDAGPPLSGGSRSHDRAAMTEQEEQELRQRLAQLKEEHRDLDSAILALEGSLLPDHLQIKRLKKRKLYLRDRIHEIDDLLFPDIIA